MRASSLPSPNKISIAPDVPDAACGGAVLAWACLLSCPDWNRDLTISVGSSNHVVPGDGGPVMPHVVFSHATCSGIKGAATIRTRSSTIAGLSSR